MHADLDDDDQVLLVIKGRLAELMAIIEPKIYWMIVAKSINGKKVPYVKFQKALYGLLKGLLSFTKSY